MPTCNQAERMYKSTLRVLFVDYIRSELGGGYFVLARLANYFSAHSDSRVIPHVLMNNTQGFVEKFINNNIAWYPLNIPKSISSAGRRASFSRVVKACLSLAIFLITFTIRVMRICRKNKIQIIHANGITALALMAVPAKISGLKLVYHLHDALLSGKDGGTIEPLAQCILLFLLRHFADVIVVVSNFVGKTLTCKDASLSLKVRLLHNGLDIDSIRQSNIKRYQGGPPAIVSFGVLSARKGFHAGIEALSILKHEFRVNSSYRIIGDGSFRDNLLDLVRKRKVSDQVELIGFQDNVHKYVAQADVVLIPSIWEDPSPLVVIESMANSKVIIASKAGGIPEMISDGKEGFLVPKDNSRQIAEKIIYIMKHPDEANRMADNAYKRVQSGFSIERMASQVENVYRSILND